MSLGKDLAAVRNKLGLSIDEIQNQIKIPADVLKTIEDDTIFGELATNKTYTRSFVRSYAKALGLADDLIVAALDSLEAGLYEHGTILDEELAKKHAPLINPEVLDDDAHSGEAKLVRPEIEEAPQKPTPTVENVNWADLGKQFSTQTSNPKILVPVIIALVIIGLAVIIYIYKEPILGIFSGSDEPEISETILGENETTNEGFIQDSVTTTSTNQDLATLPESAISTEVESGTSNTNLGYSSVLSDTLTVTVYAAYDKLEPVRITSDFNWRTNPFWMEQGEAFNFNFTDTVLVRGQYSRMILLFNGHTIDNPFIDYYDETFDSILLTREALNSDFFLAPPPSEFPYEVGAPDSLVFPLQN